MRELKFEGIGIFAGDRECCKCTRVILKGEECLVQYFEDPDAPSIQEEKVWERRCSQCANKFLKEQTAARMAAQAAQDAFDVNEFVHGLRAMGMEAHVIGFDDGSPVQVKDETPEEHIMRKAFADVKKPFFGEGGSHGNT